MQDLTALLAFFLPLGIVGAWRWGAWAMKKIIGLFYRPVTGEYQSTVSVVTPVYNEDPGIFRRALDSWKANGPAEIIAVIDASDKSSIGEFESFSRDFKGARLIVTEKPGKRPALADGIKAAGGEIVALVDSDVIWEKDVLAECLRPFADKKVAGVGTRQNVLEPETMAQDLFDIQLDLRFSDDMLPSAAAGSVFTCLSGRTAFYRREVVLPLLDDLVYEKFWGKQCIGGDDKRLTYLVEAAGWKCRYQHFARVYTTGAKDMKTFYRQRTRWSRNSWRADLRALWQGWVWKHPFLAFILIDRTISNFTLLLSLVYFVVSIILQLWLPAGIIAGWWLFSRAIRLMPHIIRRPDNIVLVPFYILVNFSMAVVRIYSLFTLNRQDWLTRGAGKKQGSLGLVLAKLGTAAVIILLGVVVYNSRF
jgi:hyaluronan synthase